MFAMNGQAKQPIKKGPTTKVISSKFGALAIDRSNGFYYGWSFDHSTLSEAEKKAIEECNKKGGNCTVVLSYSGNGCAAYRTIDGKVGTAFGWGLANTKEEANAIATKECIKRSNGKNPANFVWSCNSTNAGTLKEIYNASAEIMGASTNKKHLTDENGEEYDFDGTIFNNEPKGTGTATYIKSGNIYKGNYVNGNIEGKGEAIFKSGDHYIGGMSKGKFSGYGVYTFKSGNKYEGQFVDSKKHGKGKFTEADGGYYEGDFVNNLMQGFGKYVDANGKILFEGRMENDNPVQN
jgi:hypothetical protein